MLKENEVVEVFCCKSCNAVLFRKEDISDHESNKQTFEYRKMQKEINEDNKGGCTSYFLPSPTKWVNEVNDLSLIEGKIKCYKCKKRVGTFHWNGSQCSCGSWINPAIQFPKSKLDGRKTLKKRLHDRITVVE